MAAQSCKMGCNMRGTLPPSQQAMQHCPSVSSWECRSHLLTVFRKPDACSQKTFPRSAQTTTHVSRTPRPGAYVNTKSVARGCQEPFFSEEGNEHQKWQSCEASKGPCTSIGSQVIVNVAARGGNQSRKYASGSSSPSATYASTAKAPQSDSKASYDQDSTLQVQSKEVVIVGAGIAGLAAALALHRVGIKSLVLESAPAPRDSGAAIALWRNAWRALDVLGVGDKLRHEYILLDRVQLCTKKGKVVREFGLDEVKGGPHEYRGVHRSALLRVLAAELPEGSIRYGAGVQEVEAPKEGQGAELVLDNGERLRAKVVIGCDGNKSAVGRHLSLSEPNYAGYSAIRGVAHFAEGHNQRSAVRQIWGAGVRAGTYPMNGTDVYWFTVFNSPAGVRAANADERKQQALDSVAGWGGDILDIIGATPAEATTRSDIRDRWTLPTPVGGKQAWGRGNVTVAGDAAHPMTPNLGQGGCAALEDAVVLARALAHAKSSNPANSSRNGGHVKGSDQALDPELIEAALRKYEQQRIPRAAKLTVQSWVYGTLLQIGFPPVTIARDNVVVPYLFRPDHWLDHTLYDCGELPAN